MEKQKKTMVVLATLALVALAMLLPPMVLAGDLEPSAAPGPTMKTLDQIPPTWSIKLPPEERFVVLDNFADSSGAAVLDKETGLVWHKYPGGVALGWNSSRDLCWGSHVGQRFGWRLPTAEELASLIEFTENPPHTGLPVGHPFESVDADAYYWTSTSSSSSNDSYYAMQISGSNGGRPTALEVNTSTATRWCVRGRP